jgi:hypothetical protein
MRLFLQALSTLILVALLGVALLYYAQSMTLDQTKTASWILTLGWFVVTPFWMGRSTSDQAVLEPSHDTF